MTTAAPEREARTNDPARTMAEILEVATHEFADKGLAGARIDEIAAATRTSKRMIYYYFESKEDLYLFVCQDGMERSRQAVYGDLNPEWDIYRQLAHIFRQGMRFVLAFPEYLSLYDGIASPGMERFSDQLSLAVEKYTSDYLKQIIRRDIASGLVRGDLDVNYTAFLINSLYIVLLTSLVSQHYKIRMREYLEIEDTLDESVIAEHLRRTGAMIDRLLRPPKG
jgi:AcrR family transcriptional regulator